MSTIAPAESLWRDDPALRHSNNITTWQCWDRHAYRTRITPRPASLCPCRLPIPLRHSLGWLGVALTGSDTASNVLFGGLQKITAEQLGLSPYLMGAANSSGGVMGKMIDAQSIVVASTATNWFGHEGSILRFVFWHSITLACLVGVLVMLQAYVFTGMIVHP
jgi:hypothetical protein